MKSYLTRVRDKKIRNGLLCDKCIYTICNLKIKTKKLLFPVYGGAEVARALLARLISEKTRGIAIALVSSLSWCRN